MNTLAHPRSAARPATRRLLGCAALLLAGVATAGAQTPAPTPTTAPAAERTGADPRSYVTRPELETLAAREEQAGRREAAAAIRERLRTGDFRVGDRIVLSTAMTMQLPEQLAEALNDTFTVRAGRVIQIPNMTDLSLDGVLRSELDARLRAHLARYLRGEPTVRAEPLMQVLISGQVGRQGYFAVAPDMLVSDAIMTGGPAGDADVTRSFVRRNGQVLVPADSLQRAIRSGATLDRMDIRAGDELVVAQRRQTNWALIAQVVGVVSSVTWLAFALANR